MWAWAPEPFHWTPRTGTDVAIPWHNCDLSTLTLLLQQRRVPELRANRVRVHFQYQVLLSTPWYIQDSRLQRCCGQPLLFNLVCQIRLKTQRAKQLANQSTQIAHAIHRRPRDDFGCSPSPDLTSSAPFPAQASKCLVLRLPSAKKPYTAQARHCRMRDVIEQSRSS